MVVVIGCGVVPTVPPAGIGEPRVEIGSVAADGQANVSDKAVLLNSPKLSEEGKPTPAEWMEATAPHWSPQVADALSKLSATIPQ